MGTSSLPKELAEHLMVPFTSSERPLLTLFMDVIAPARGGPWPPLFLFHGWHQDLIALRDRARFFAEQGFCVLNLNLRGRCGTVGEPDACGWEIRDAADALQKSRHSFPQLCAENLAPRAFGISGGGGNVYALIGKCPDLVASAVVWCGVSDFKAWYEWNEQGNYRDEMETWTGVSPRSHPEAFRSRSGLTVAGNRICSLMVVHGTEDGSVPVGQGRLYRDAQAVTPETPPIEYFELTGVDHSIPNDPYLGQAAEFLLKNAGPVYVPSRGRWTVAGFLKTRYFEVQWERIACVGNLDIDLRRRRAHLECPSSPAAQLRLAGPLRHAELLNPTPKGARILSLREEAGWSVLDLHIHGQAVGLRWDI